MTITNDQQPIDNNILRLLIREAVEREIATTVAPLRTQLQVQDGMLKQFNKDVLLLQADTIDLNELVRGNPKQNLVGLAEQIKEQNNVLNRLQTGFNAAIADVKKELLVQVEQIKAKQDEATKQRDALINQWRGARYAITALAIITGLANYEVIAKLFALINP